jgi:hypothetical protein
MVRAAIASFGVPFILGLGTLAVYRNTKDLFLPMDPVPGQSSTKSGSAAAPKGDEAAPAAEERPSLEDVARRRAEQMKQDELRSLQSESLVHEWMVALTEKSHDAASAENQQALASAAGQFASVFLTRTPQEAAIADIRPELDYDVLDKCLAALAALPESSLRQDLDAYIRSKVVKLAEVFEMHPVDRERLAHLAAAAAEAAGVSGDK